MRGRGGQKRQHIFRRFRIILDSFGTFCPKCPVFFPNVSFCGGQTQKGAMVTMVALLFDNKSAMVRLMVGLWSLWSGRGGFWEKRSDHSDHRRDHRRDHSTFVEKTRVTIVTIALFWVLARGARDTGQNGTKRDKTGQSNVYPSTMVFEGRAEGSTCATRSSSPRRRPR